MKRQLDVINIIKPICLFEQFFDYQIRLNNTPSERFSEISVTSNVITTAAGSAMVTVGATRVLCGIKVKIIPIVDIGCPFVCLVEEAGLSQRLTCTTSAGSKETQSLSSKLEWLISKVAVPDAKEQLLIYNNVNEIPKPYGSYILHIDVMVIHDDGCLLDACLNAALAALSSAKWPRLQASENQSNISTSAQRIFEEIPNVPYASLSLRQIPVALTFCIVPRPPGLKESCGNSLISQPSKRELVLWDTDATVCQLVMDSNDLILYNSLVGGFSSSLWQHLEDADICVSRSVLSTMIERAINQSNIIRNILKAL